MLVSQDYHVWLMLLGVALAAQNYTYYVLQTLKGVFKPHMFSWGVWTLLSAIAFAAQWSKDAGPGTWQTAFMTLGVATITIVAFFKGDRNYTRTDWISLVFSLSAIPLWIVTKDPLWSVILITIIDIVATWPTVRKSWHRPHQESARAFATAALTCFLGFASLSIINVTTGLYMGTVTLVNIGITIMILFRRKVIPQ